MSETRKTNKKRDRPAHKPYQCEECGCLRTSYEMGGFVLGWHFRGCSEWDRYIDAGTNPFPSHK